MATEYALFNDEGMVEGGFYSVEEATAAIADRYSEDDELTVEEVCHDHPEQPKCGCVLCDDEGDDEPGRPLIEILD